MDSQQPISTHSQASLWQLEVLLPIALGHGFSYLSATPVSRGRRVLVPLLKQQRVGVVIDCHKPLQGELNDKLKWIIAVLDEQPLLPQSLVQLIDWMVDYYHCWPGEVWQTATPSEFWKFAKRGLPLVSQRLPHSAVDSVLEDTHWKHLNQQQKQAFEAISSSIQSPSRYQAWLLHGVTGSGKTEIYLGAAWQALSLSQQVLILVPEISLIQQNMQRFSHHFGQVDVFHSGLTPKQRLDTWQRCLRQQAKVILATRSGIFLPFQRLGLIVVDEEHDDSYKQLDGCRYQARDVAVMRAHLEKLPIILGSATPSYESLRNQQRGRYQLVQLKQRAGSASKPKIRFVDMRKRRGVLSDVMLSAIDERLKNQQQGLLFLNRRGFSPLLYCDSCGWHPLCGFCGRSPTFHQNKQLLHCHLCDWKSPAPKRCEACQSTALIHLGVGTEQVEQLLKQHFPKARIARLDRDTTQKKGALQETLQRVHNLDVDLLLGTQMLSKGHDLPKLTLVGILNVDASLLSPFYRAEEKLMQLLTQVAGRSGRGKHAGEVILQTHYPQHELLQSVFRFGYFQVASNQLQQRRQASLPPWSEQALVRVEAIKQQQAETFARAMHHCLQQHQQHCQLTPVVPANIERVRNHYRWQFLLMASKKSTIQNSLTSAVKEIQGWPRPRGLRWFVDLTPIEL